MTAEVRDDGRSGRRPASPVRERSIHRDIRRSRDAELSRDRSYSPPRHVRDVPVASEAGEPSSTPQDSDRGRNQRAVDALTGEPDELRRPIPVIEPALAEVGHQSLVVRREALDLTGTGLLLFMEVVTTVARGPERGPGEVCAKDDPKRPL